MVTVGESFVVNQSGGDLKIRIYDFQGGPLLQNMEKYHLSCSQDITLGDVLGGVTLTGRMILPFPALACVLLGALGAFAAVGGPTSATVR